MKLGLNFRQLSYFASVVPMQQLRVFVAQLSGLRFRPRQVHNKEQGETRAFREHLTQV